MKIAVITCVNNEEEYAQALSILTVCMCRTDMNWM